MQCFDKRFGFSNVHAVYVQSLLEKADGRKCTIHLKWKVMRSEMVLSSCGSSFHSTLTLQGRLTVPISSVHTGLHKGGGEECFKECKITEFGRGLGKGGGGEGGGIQNSLTRTRFQADGIPLTKC